MLASSMGSFAPHPVVAGCTFFVGVGHLKKRAAATGSRNRFNSSLAAMPSLHDQMVAKEREMQSLREELESFLESNVMPFREEMQRAANDIDLSDQAELKATPPKKDEITKVMSCVVFVLDEGKPSSTHWMSKAFAPGFIFELRGFDSNDKLKDEVLERLEEHCSDPSLSVEKMDSWKCLKMVKSLNRWLFACRSYGKAMAEMQPKMEELPCLHWIYLII